MAPKRSQQQKEQASQAYINLGLGYFRQNDRVPAIQNLEKAIEINPDSAVAHNYLAVIYQEYGRPKLAMEFYQRALSLDSKSGELHNNFGIFLYSQKKYSEAEKQFLLAVDDIKYSTPETALEHAALSALGQSDKKKAEMYLRQALAMNPKLPGALYEMAKLSMENKKYLGVRAYLQRFEDVAKHTPESLWLAIRAERMLKDKTAVARFSAALRLNFPNSEQALRLKTLQLKNSGTGS